MTEGSLELCDSHANLVGSADSILPGSSSICNQMERSQLFTSCAPFVTLRRASSAPRNITQAPSQQLKSPVDLIKHYGENLTRKLIKRPDALPEKLTQSMNDRIPPTTAATNDEFTILGAHLTPNSPHLPFEDPLLKELDADLPIPPPPPKAIPFWLKSSLRRQEMVKTPASTFSAPLSQSLTPPSTPTSDFEMLDKRNSRSLGHDDVRICPIVQSGVKLSDTHYWLLQPPPSHRYKSSILRFQSERVPPPTPTELGLSNQYLNLQSPVKLRRGLSDCHKNTWSAIHQEQVQNLRTEVPSATEAECQAILIGCGYKFDEAVKKLKLELLYRKGYISRSRCGRLLYKNHWSLEDSIKAARKEYETQRSHLQSPVSMSSISPNQRQVFTFGEEETTEITGSE